ncbi:hypothetical protein A6M21_09815 [Desulfotomaculum copahuensis]|uniref:Uncharacterized protein n=1 Tax=Desulfotomaculum copahuensis TaxID=1838280 RepID=A0A1B7LEI5_9FIRM|nr:hypothetical protein A6M21_09815 [Desulfotomaculum copahuensis]
MNLSRLVQEKVYTILYHKNRRCTATAAAGHQSPGNTHRWTSRLRAICPATILGNGFNTIVSGTAIIVLNHRKHMLKL